jgi:hypothetical protein
MAAPENKAERVFEIVPDDDAVDMHDAVDVHDRAPFSAGMYRADLQDGRWNWGRYSPGAPGGFSAEVSFSQDGGGLKVRIHYSVDTAIDLDEAGRDRNRDRIPLPRP